MKLLTTAINCLSTSKLSWTTNSLFLVGALFVSHGFPMLASAESVMERVSQTKTLTAGTSNEAFPFAFADADGELQGYSIDMLKQIQARLSQELGEAIELKLVPLTPEERISSLLDGNVDIICDASSYTWEREQKIDFSVSYGLTGTRLLGAKTNLTWSRENLAGKRIAVVAGTTNAIAIRQALPEAQIMTTTDHAEGYDLLVNQQVDAFAADGILLEGWLQTSERASNFAVFEDFSREGIACMMPENNSQFANHVDYSLVRFMEGYLQQKPSYVEIFDRWFGTEAKVPLTQDFRSLVLETMQLVIDFKEQIPDSEL